MADKAYRFVVIGAGGIGSSLCNYLAMMLEYKAPFSGLLIVDGDTFEPKNKERQLFKEYGNKAESLAADLAPQYSKTAIIPIGKWVVETVPEDAESDTLITAASLLQEGDVIFPVVDNFKARKLIFDVASTMDNIDVISAGNDDALFCSMYHYQRRDGKDVTMHPRHLHPEYENPPDRNPGELSCQERAAIEGGTQLLAANVGATALILGKVQTVVFDAAERDDENEDYPDETFWQMDQGLAASFNRSAEQLASAEVEAGTLTTTGVS
jgi:hypothetical protein